MISPPVMPCWMRVPMPGGKDDLDDDRAAHEVADLEAERGDRRDEALRKTFLQ